MFQNIKIVSCILLLFLASTLSFASTPSHKRNDDKNENSYQARIAKLPYFVDDIQIIAGWNTGGLYMSKNYRELSYAPGFQIGLENYVPIGQIVFLNYGVHFSQRNFKFKNDLFINNFIDIPIYVSYELPVLKNIDLRFLLGAQVGTRVSSSAENTLFEGTLEETFPFNPENFNRFDMGWTFGISGEYKSLFFRARSYVGTGALSASDHGTFHSINFDLGYFLFRNLRK